MAAGPAGNRVNKGQSSGPKNGGSTHHSGMYFSSALWAIAKKLPPNERVEIKKKNPQKVKPTQLSDDQAKDVIRRNRMGVSIRALADSTGYSESCLKAICNGTNRAHLLRDVEMEGMK